MSFFLSGMASRWRVDILLRQTRNQIGEKVMSRVLTVQGGAGQGSLLDTNGNEPGEKVVAIVSDVKGDWCGW